MEKVLRVFAGLASGDPRERLRAIWLTVGVPAVAIAAFLWVWAESAARVQTSLGAVPGPVQVLSQARSLLEDHVAERAKQAEFYRRQEARNEQRLAEDPKAEVTIHKWTGKPTFVDQILTSLKTVFTGFLFATLVAVPLGILCGSSRVVQSALNPMIQVFRPVSPLAWLPIVTLIVSALYVTSDGALFEKSFLVSAITVTLCSLWPTLINTAVGVTSIERDLINVSRVLQLAWATKVRKIVVPSALPYIFTGMRLSLGVGWMVLIAAEMLAQNPGLGKFVWDEFQNGSQESLSRIMVAVLAIGIIGFLLDRLMLGLQHLATRG
ncbi:MAG TPA: ABC transporter permease [Burkholderiales bacterium]|nr:ABC transporter permease [Burkholderiales bacterium]